MSADQDTDDEPNELPDWVKEMVVRRTQELRDDSSIGLSYDQMWQRIRSRYADRDTPETST